jgi:carboxylesterase type B
VIGEYLGGKPYTSASWEADISNASFPLPDINNGTSEDCLFLDVYTPGKVLKQATETPQPSGGAPVLVWI